MLPEIVGDLRRVSEGWLQVASCWLVQGSLYMYI